jgi:transcriptional regulator with XRE-family HTH domain
MEGGLPIAKFGNQALGRRLRTARLRAGYRSAQVAAAAQGWPTATYRAHENGGRKVPDEMLNEYAKAYKISLVWLKTGAATDANDPPAKSSDDELALWKLRSNAEDKKKIAGKRLRLVRLARGFATALDAAEKMKVNGNTYANLESGRNGLTTATRALATAYGIREDWLRYGTLPSGLGAEADTFLERLNSQEWNPEWAADNLFGLVDVGLRTTASDGVRLTRDPRSSVPVSASAIAVQEFNLGQLVASSSRNQPQRTWLFPRDIVDVNDRDSDLLIVALGSRALEIGLRAGGRVVLDRSRVDMNNFHDALLIHPDGALELLVRPTGTANDRIEAMPDIGSVTSPRPTVAFLGFVIFSIGNPASIPEPPSPR